MTNVLRRPVLPDDKAMALVREGEFRLPPNASEWARQMAYLAAFGKFGTQAAACRAVGVGKHKVYEWELDPEFVDAELAVKNDVADSIEEVFVERARDKKDPKGHVCGIFLLKGLRPEKYREDIGPQVSVVNRIDLSRFSREELEQILKDALPSRLVESPSAT